MLPEIARGEQDAVKYHLLVLLNCYEVRSITNATVREFQDDGVIDVKEGKEEKLTGFDSIVLAMGAITYNPLEERIKKRTKEVYVIEDALNARKAPEANEEAIFLATKI